MKMAKVLPFSKLSRRAGPPIWFLALFVSACGGSSPAMPSPSTTTTTTVPIAAPPTAMTATFRGEISGTEPACAGATLTFACKQFGPIVAKGGPLSATLTWQQSNTSLIFWLVDEQGRVLVSGGDTVNTPQGRTKSLTANAQSATYYIQVTWFTGSFITPFEVTVSWQG